jgi:ABC-type phosphate transport system substrate-binding protein
VNHLRAITVAGFLAATVLPAAAAEISGAGATFPYPVYAKWADTYRKETGVGLNYQSIGSGGGIKQIEAKTVTFGATDAPLKGAELDKFGLVQFPMVMGGIVPVVNIDGVAPSDLVLDGPTLAAIFLGTVKSWDDPAIKKLMRSLAWFVISPPRWSRHSCLALLASRRRGHRASSITTGGPIRRARSRTAICPAGPANNHTA